MEPPKNVVFSLPPEQATRQQLHYIVVQVSKYRYVVAEYADNLQKILTFQVVSKPMKYLEAVEHAKELTAKR